VSITGGFVLDAGPLHLSVRNPLRPLILAALAAALLVRGGAAAAVDLAQRTSASIERHGAHGAVIAAAAVAGAGVAWGTYAASGSDAAGYVSEAGLIASGRLTIDTPLSLMVDWLEAAEAFAPLGYRPGLLPGSAVPTYPPGLPLVIAAAGLAGPFGPYFVSPLLGAVAVLAVFWLARRLHSVLAGVIAAVLCATSPILLFQITQPMSDAPAAAWWALALMLAARATPGSAALAGMAAGLGFVTRPVLVLMLFPACLAVLSGGGRWRSLLAMAAGFTPFAAGLALLQHTLYGNPMASGHGSFAYLFQLENVPENLQRYAGRLVAGEPSTLILIALAIPVLLVKRSVPENPSPGAAVLIGAASLGAVLACYLPYGVFDEWSYLRFLLPAFPAVFVAAGTHGAAAARALPHTTRGLTVLVALSAAGAVNIETARRHEAFLVRRSEARYQITGSYISALLPSDAVVLAGQQSGAIHHYANRPIVRWDALRVGLEQAVGDLVALDKHPFLVLEDWEERDIRARFPSSSLARLDWRPVADIGDHVRVRVYDPTQRAAPTDADPRVDRIHAP